MIENRRVIIYHDNCLDGITALWAAKDVWPGAESYAGKYDSPPDLARLKEADVLFVDFCWKRSAMIEVAKVAHSVLVLDHHKSAQEAMFAEKGEWFFECTTPPTVQGIQDNVTQDICEGVPHAVVYCYFDMNRSGAGIAWDVLHPDKPRPALINHVEDRDLWRRAVPGSDEVYAACASYPLTLETRDSLMRRDISTLIDEGRHILRYHNQLVEGAMKSALQEEIGGIKVPSVAHPNVQIASDLAGRLAVGHPFAAVWHDRPDGSRYYSLRSAPDGIDVSEVAKKFGGGGHFHASGFTKRNGNASQT